MLLQLRRSRLRIEEREVVVVLLGHLLVQLTRRLLHLLAFLRVTVYGHLFGLLLLHGEESHLCTATDLLHVRLVKAQVVDSLVVRVQIGRCHRLLDMNHAAVRFLLQLQSLVDLALLLLQLVRHKVAVVHG